MVDFSGLYENVKSCFFKLEAKILIICYRISSQVNFDVTHVGNPPPRLPAAEPCLAARGEGEARCTLLCYHLTAESFQLAASQQNSGDICGKTCCFSSPLFYQEGFCSWAQGDRSGVAVGRCLPGCPTEKRDAGPVGGAGE